MDTVWSDVTRYLVNVVIIVGAIHCSKHALHLLRGVYIHFIRPICAPIDLKTRFGPWAVVTGGSDGIGESYARELARRGLNLVLISEKLARLQEVKTQIEREHRVQVKFIHADLSKGKEVYDKIGEELKHLDVGVLVNCAGVLNPYPMKLSEMSEDLAWSHVLVNVAALTLMCRLLLPEMSARGRGVIVNMASLATVGGTPYFAVYSATKSYVQSLSEALQFEYRGTGVEIQVLTPNPVKTNMLKFNSILHNVVATNVELYTRKCVNTLGVVHKTTGYFVHGIQRWVCEAVPVRVFTMVEGYFMEFTRHQNNKAL